MYNVELVEQREVGLHHHAAQLHPSS